MANEIRKKFRAAITAQASAAITADAFSGGSETVLDNTYDGGSENCLGAEFVELYLNVTSGPTSAASAEVWAAHSHDGTNYTAYEYVASVEVPTGTGLYFVGYMALSSYNKLKIKAIDYGFTAALTAVPVLMEAQ